MLLKMSISAGALIMLIIALRAVAINRLPKKVFVLLWDIALLRLLVPANLPFSYGIDWPAVKMADSGFSRLANRVGAANISGDAPHRAWAAGSVEMGLNRPDLPFLAWMAGVAVLLAAFAALYAKERRKLQEALPLSKEMEGQLRRLADIPGQVRLLALDRISSPVVFGVFWPKIIMPRNIKGMAAMELRCTLTHEMVHIRRADNLWKAMMVVAVCLHWANPLVWAMYALYHRDLELSCDEKAISLLGEDIKKEYAMTLVHFAEYRRHLSAFSNGFGKNAVQERIEAIMNLKKATVFTIGCATALLGAALSVFAQNNLPVDAAGDSSIGYMAYVSEGEGSQVSCALDEYNEETILGRLEEIEKDLKEKFEQLCSGRGEKSKLGQEIEAITDEQLELEAMLSNLQSQEYNNETYSPSAEKKEWVGEWKIYPVCESKVWIKKQ